MSHYFIFDLETVPDRSLPERGTDDFPPPIHHKIVCLGWTKIDIEEKQVRIGASTGAEVPILTRFCGSPMFATPERSHQRGSSSVTLCTFNGRRFDIPVLVARCMKHGIQWPWFFREKAARIRYSADAAIDLYDELTEFGAAQSAGLNTWSRAVGLAGKTGTGASVDSLVFAEKWDDLAAYCVNDVRMTAGLLLRWLVIRGRIAGDTEASLRELILGATPKVDHEP